MKHWRLIITCEHGGNSIPPTYRHLFKGKRMLLDSHRGYDLGALPMARRMAKHFEAPLYAATRSRLLVDLNRSIGNPGLFSEITRSLAPEDKETLLGKYYASHRDQVQGAISALIHSGEVVLHIAVHSFTPVLKGRERSMDVGLLYDPQRRGERLFCHDWKRALLNRHPNYQVRCNAPYKGVSDGLATFVRSLLARNYMGIELELNQSHYQQGRNQWRRLCTAVVDSLDEVLSKHHP